MTFDEMGFPDGAQMVDPLVKVHLLSGHTLHLQEVSIVELAKRLHHYGFVFLGDGQGEYAVLFSHGVAALVASSNDK